MLRMIDDDGMKRLTFRRERQFDTRVKLRIIYCVTLLDGMRSLWYSHTNLVVRLSHATAPMMHWPVQTPLFNGWDAQMIATC